MRFHMPTKIFFNSGAITQLEEVVKGELKSVRPFLVIDKGIQSSGIADKVLSRLPGISFFDEIEQNPKHLTVDKAGEIVRKLKPDLIIGLGGGSVLDASKAIALLATNKGEIEDYEGKAKYKALPLPVLAIPTTCGTGSEVTWVSVITHMGRKFKMSVKGPEMFPAVALVDPDLLETLPAPLVASTGMDALVHAVEAYTVKPANSVTDLFAREAMGLIFDAVEPAFRDIKRNKSARENIMRGSLLAGIAFCNSDVGAVHCISEAIGALFDVPHGVANAIFLPYVMEFNLPAVLQKFAEIAALVGIDSENEKESSQKIIQKIKELSASLRIPCFRDLNISPDSFSEIATKAYENNSNPSNPRLVGIKDYMEILNQAYHLA